MAYYRFGTPRQNMNSKVVNQTNSINTKTTTTPCNTGCGKVTHKVVSDTGSNKTCNKTCNDTGCNRNGGDEALEKAMFHLRKAVECIEFAMTQREKCDK